MPGETYRDIYEPKVREAAKRYGVPEEILVRMIATESSFDPNAINPTSGAQGIGQFMPDTARELGIDAMNPEEAIDGSARYLRMLIDAFGGDVRKGVAAYNTGVGTVAKAQAFGGDKWADRLPDETKQYLQSVFAPQRGPSGAGSTETGINPGELPPPSIESFRVWEQDPTTGESVWTGEYDYNGYYNALAGFRELSKTQTQDLAQHLDDVIAGIGLDIEAGRLTLDKAAGEFDRQFTAYKEAGEQYQNLLGYAVPKNALFVPGREPGGFYETQTGLNPRPASGEFRDPFAEVLDIVNRTPDLTSVETPGVGAGSPNNLFAQALELDRLSSGTVPNQVRTGKPYEERDVDIARRLMGDVPIGVY